MFYFEDIYNYLTLFKIIHTKNPVNKFPQQFSWEEEYRRLTELAF